MDDNYNEMDRNQYEGDTDSMNTAKSDDTTYHAQNDAYNTTNSGAYDGQSNIPQQYSEQPNTAQQYSGQPNTAQQYAGQPNASQSYGGAYGGAQSYGTQNNGMPGANPYQQYQNPYQQYQNAPNYNRQAPNKKKKKEKKTGGIGSTLGKAVAVALVFGLVAGLVFTGVAYVGSNTLGISASTDSDSNSSSLETSVSSTSTNATATDLVDVSDIVDEVMPSIVAITNISTVTYDSMFGGSETYESTSLGSGIIIAQDDDYLYICTNNHVVSGAESLTVQFVDDSTVSAEITGTDSADDLAVIQVALSSIEEDTLSQIKVATVDDSGDVEVGEATIAIGNALGYGQSVTTGVVSATGRTVSVTDSTTGTTVTNTNLIQTDAAINSGNSGGALLNANGAVIGINAAKYSATGVEGIGYAIPMSDAYPIILAIIAGEDIPQSAYLGISGQSVSTDVASVYGVPEGVLVVEVYEDTAAEQAGILAGDIITALNGEEITTMDALKTALTAYKEGDTVTLTVAHKQNGYAETDITVTLGGQTTTTTN